MRHNAGHSSVSALWGKIFLEIADIFHAPALSTIILKKIYIQGVLGLSMRLLKICSIENRRCEVLIIQGPPVMTLL